VDVEVDLVALEKERIKGAIRTDFILSAEIVVIALGTMATEPIGRQIGALSAIGVLITVLVYGLVAGIVKLDDLGLQLHQAGGAFKPFGAFILRLAPLLLRTLTVVGTAAMFMVGGNIIAHGVPAIEHVVAGATSAVGGGIVGTLVKTLLDALVGVVAGGIVVGVLAIPRFFRRPAPAKPEA
jgi:predicted DNA repair protein MutK